MQFKRLLLILISGLLFLGQHKAWAQATTSLTGHVTDPTGMVIPGATATLSLTNTQSVRISRTRMASTISPSYSPVVMNWMCRSMDLPCPRTLGSILWSTSQPPTMWRSP